MPENQMTETAQVFPVVKTYSDMMDLTSLDEKTFKQRIADWESEGDSGADLVGKAVCLRCVRQVLEERHPTKTRGFTTEDLKALEKEITRLRTATTSDIFGRETYEYRARVDADVYREVEAWFPLFITPALRECVVKQHARGMSTGQVVDLLLSGASQQPTVFSYLSKLPMLPKQQIKAYLIPRLAYLRAGAVSFPQKYQELWESERKLYLSEIKDVPLTDTAEQVKALSQLYIQLQDAFDASETDRGKAQLSDAMVKVLSGLFTLTRDPATYQQRIEGEKSSEVGLGTH